jgi:hypothetical protein
VRFETAPREQGQVDFAWFQVAFIDEPGTCRRFVQTDLYRFRRL